MAGSQANGGASGRMIAEQLRVAIVTGEYAPGERILQEELAERFGASRLPIRDALRILEVDGLITVVANAGAWVSRLTLAQCEELYQMRESLEPLLLGYSMPNLSIVTLNRLDRLADEMQETEDPDSFLRLSREFHLLSYSGAHTSMLANTVNRLWDSTEHYRHAFTRFPRAEGGKDVHWEHKLMVSALAREDAEDAKQILASHIRRTRLAITNHRDLFAE
ncbi:MAG: GntR family transcriptional regulator [Microbacteriaceae bacterium]|jgi:DNA-binding GntR family transcriptional regulator|nr:GntR family transcriptional regulator [Microbacteriaceae bacterium]